MVLNVDHTSFLNPANLIKIWTLIKKQRTDIAGDALILLLHSKNVIGGYFRHITRS